MSRDWTKRFFRSEVFTPGDPDALAAAPAEAAAAWKLLGLRKGMKVLDVACGTGRHTVEFARRGAYAVGVDKTREYLDVARRLAKGRKNVSFAEGDMRRLPFAGEFDAAVNLWTSFGYFEKPSDDLAVLKGIARSLKPGGRFLIELVDHAWIRARTSHRHWSRRGDGSYLLQEAFLVGGADPRVINEWTILRRSRAPQRTRFTVRGYDLKRLSALMRKAGLKPVKSWDTLIPADRPNRFNGRLVVLARKP